MNKLYITLLMGLFLFSFASATETFKQETSFDVKLVCLNDGYCSAAAFCNVNIEGPSGTLLVEGENMTNNNVYHNYTLSNTVIGTYSVTGYCQDGVDYQRIDYYFELTTNGKPIDESHTYAYVFLIIVLGGFAALMVWLLTKLPSANAKDNENRVIQVTWLKYLRLPCIGVAYICITGVVYISGTLGLAYLGPGIGQILIYIAMLMMWGSLLLMGILFMKAFDDVIADTKLRNDLSLGVERG